MAKWMSAPADWGAVARPAAAFAAIGVIGVLSFVQPDDEAVSPSAFEAAPDDARAIADELARLQQEWSQAASDRDAVTLRDVAAGEIAIGAIETASAQTSSSASVGRALVDPERFEKGLAAAHRSADIGSWLRLTHLESGQQVQVRVVARHEDDFEGGGQTAALVVSPDVPETLGFDADVLSMSVLIEPAYGAAARPLAALSTLSVGRVDPQTIETASLEGAQTSAPVIGVRERFLDFGIVEGAVAADALIASVSEALPGLANVGAVTKAPVEGSPGRYQVTVGPLGDWMAAIRARRAAIDAGYESADILTSPSR